MKRWSSILGLLCVLMIPALLLGPCLFGERTFVPFDIAQFPPISTELEDGELERIYEGQNTMPTEVVLTFIPELRFARQELEAGRLPQWNPSARFGAPLAATVVTGLNYPLNWITLAFDDPQDGMALACFFSLAIAGALMFGFLRRLNLSLAASMLGALAFSLSGMMTCNVYFYQRLASLIWLPGTLWGVHAVILAQPGHRIRPILGLSFCVSMILLAGFPYFVIAGLVGTAVYAAVLFYAVLRNPRSDTGDPAGVRAAMTGLGWVAVAAILTLGLTAFELIPMTTFFSNLGVRDGIGVDDYAANGLSLNGFLGSIMPGLFGHPYHPEHDSNLSVLSYGLLARESWDGERIFDPHWNFIEATVFVGTLTLPLALFAAVRPRRPIEVAMAIATVVIVLISQGLPWLSWLHTAPGMNVIQPTRLVVGFVVVICVLAAFGFDRLMAERRSHRQWIVCALLGVAAFVCLCVWQIVRGMSGQELLDAWLPSIYERFSPHRPGLSYEAASAHLSTGAASGNPDAARDAIVSSSLRAGLMLGLSSLWFGVVGRAASSLRRTRLWMGAGIAFLTLELVVFGMPLVQGMELRVPHDSEVHRYLRSARDAAVSDGGYAAVRGTGKPATEKVLPFAFPPCYVGQQGVRDVNSYTFLDPHSHKAIARIWGEDHMRQSDVWPYSLPNDERLHHPYLDLIGVRWVLSEDPLTVLGEPVLTTGGTRTLSPDGDVAKFFVYERDSALPRAFTVPRLVALSDEAAVLDALANPEFVPRAKAWVTQEDFGDYESLYPIPPTVRESPDRAVTFVRDDVQELELEVAPGQGAWLVLNDSWYPGWSASVDGEPAPILRANVAMRAVHLKASDSATRVVFRYNAPGFALGGTLSLIALCLSLGFLVVSWVRRPGTGEPSQLPIEPVPTPPTRPPDLEA